MPFLTSVKSVAARIVPRRRRKVLENHNGAAGQKVPADFLPPLRPVDLPRILPEHRSALVDHGWTKVTFHEPLDELHRSSQALFRASKEFFDLPSAQKEAYKTQAGSEEGWSHVEGEKEFISLRRLGNTPPELKEAAQAYWAEAGNYLDELLGRVAESLGLPAAALDAYSKPCAELGLDKTATMLRLFRYDCSGENQTKTVAEGMPPLYGTMDPIACASWSLLRPANHLYLAHRDLGLLSLVIGDIPGLEVWNGHEKFWFPIERTFDSPAGCVMAGRQLEKLTNMRYPGGGHRVRSYGDAEARVPGASTNSQGYRYSIVFVLRAHSPVPVNTDELTTSITGQFQAPLKGVTAHELYKEIHASVFNINIGVEERNRQKQKLAEMKTQAVSPTLN
ncbi:uncharacterized protein BP5553_05392 [Venustampulla echinocandica]|uniref:Non-haem dioxygenase N-terminal domain-containing protein n=1 Tax=Venustampulla echinocandica TaxID=2656787 RepID=A0A370TR16_9HELO|nr:uncharacterized protein BP5553_05392 [Venustampulla echinocandica]RDL37959.1 hypothetical protein BP5553_05392 [Venustampulla echinocandica]